jgi:hypothetical protein
MNMPNYPINPVQQAVVNGIHQYFNRGTSGPTEYGQVPHPQGGYNGMQNSWTPPHVAPQHYPQPPYSGMGFNPNQSVGTHQYGTPDNQIRQGNDYRSEVRQYMRDICEGKEHLPDELMQMVCMAAAEAVEEYMGNEQKGLKHRYSAGEYSSDSHKEFKKTIEKIRKAPHYQEKMRMIAECFPSVQQGSLEHKVLVDLVTKVPSVEQRASALQIKPEQYNDVKAKLQQMHNK